MRDLHRRGRMAVACAVAVAVCVLAAGVSAVVVARRSPSTENSASTAIPTSSARKEQSTLTTAYSPCASPTQQLLTLEEARKKLGSKLLLPSDPNANSSTVKTVALCNADDSKLIIEFDNGVWVDEAPYSGPKPNPTKAVADDPNESVLGTVNGQSVWVITPAQGKFPRPGAVNLDLNGTWVVVVGNTVLTVDQLEAIAASIPAGS